jgi:putative membrane protein
MLWFKAFHVVAVVAWFAGLFYLPRLFVYHADCQDQISLERFKIMERRLYFGIMWPAAILTTVLGWVVVSYASSYYLHQAWFHWKLSLVLLLWAYHFMCGYFRKRLLDDNRCFSSGFFRVWNEVPTIILIIIVLLVVVKP